MKEMQRAQRDMQKLHAESEPSIDEDAAHTHHTSAVENLIERSTIGVVAIALLLMLSPVGGSSEVETSLCAL